MLNGALNREAVGQQMYDLMTELYPLPRSITGRGVRETLTRIQQDIPLQAHEVPTGTPVFDWTVPPEWLLRRAYIKDHRGQTIVDARDHSLHVMAYSQAVRGVMRLSELRKRIHTVPEHPDRIPYRTAYFRRDWGFCLPHRLLSQMESGGNQLYEVVIDADHFDGSLTYGECVIPGETKDEVLISTHTCHPSLCNDNLSGIVVATHLARWAMRRPRRYTYRFIFLPATIGAITWLALNQSRVSQIRHGLILTNVGDAGPCTYKRSRQGNAVIDRAAQHVLKVSGQDHEIRDFSPIGYDERQFCSPGIDLPMGCFMRTPDGEYPEYHTSADNLDFVKREALADSWAKLASVFHVLEHNHAYINQSPMCEPQLGRRGLLEACSSHSTPRERLEAMLWTLNQSTGETTLLDIAEQANLPFRLIAEAATALRDSGLLNRVDTGGSDSDRVVPFRSFPTTARATRTA
jgi:aminopeptidase-like protein